MPDGTLDGWATASVAYPGNTLEAVLTGLWILVGIPVIFILYPYITWRR